MDPEPLPKFLKLSNMAEIKVERKKQTPVWPWIIGILLLLGLIWFLVEAFNEESELEEQEIPAVEEGQSFIPENESRSSGFKVPGFYLA